MVIGQYRIIEKIGEGGMGVIYKAEHCTLEQVVAIKSLPGNLSVNSDLRERFIREAKIQARLSHPNVVNILNFFDFEGNYYIVMEYAEGETLESLIRTKGLLPPDSCINMFKQILAGVGYAHSMGIIHRDLKPSNIIIKNDGTIKITDFGIAKISGDLQRTQAGVKVGTIWYMSPEQVKGQPAGISSDIYALGVTLFEMITGKVPFSGNSEYSIMKDIVECSPPSPREFYPYVPVPLEKTIMRAIAKEPADRFKSVQEFAAALSNPGDLAAASTPSPTPANAANGPVNEGGQAPAEPVPFAAGAPGIGIVAAWPGSRRKQIVAVAAVVVSVAVLLVFVQINTKRGVASGNPVQELVSAPEISVPKADKVIPAAKKSRSEVTELLEQARVSLNQEKYVAAAEFYRQALDIDKTNLEASNGLKQVTGKLEEEQQMVTTIRSYLAKGRSSHRNGNYGKAIEMYKKVLVLSAGNEEAKQGVDDARTAREAEKQLGTIK